MRVRPKNDLVLLEVLDSEVQYQPVDVKAAKEAGSVVVRPVELVAHVGDRMHKRARVLEVGPGKRHPKTDALLPMFVEAGDLVVYEDWMVQWHNGIGTWPGPGDHALVRADNIHSVVEDEDVWLDFPREHGADSAGVPDHAFKPEEAGGRRVDGGKALESWGLA